jgi:hypothetical protein
MGVLFFLFVLFLLFGGLGIVGQIFGVFFGLFGGLLGLFFSFFFSILPFLILFKILHVIFGGHRHKAWVHPGPHQMRGHWGGFCDSSDDHDGDKRKNEDKRKRDVDYRDPQDPYQQDIQIV